jgi:hypothetical protein
LKGGGEQQTLETLEYIHAHKTGALLEVTLLLSGFDPLRFPGLSVSSPLAWGCSRRGACRAFFKSAVVF